MFARLLALRERVLVATETVVEYRGQATDQADEPALAAGSRRSVAASISRTALGLHTAPDG